MTTEEQIDELEALGHISAEAARRLRQDPLGAMAEMDARGRLGRWLAAKPGGGWETYMRNGKHVVFTRGRAGEGDTLAAAICNALELTNG